MENTKAIVVERTVTDSGLSWSVYEVVRAGETLSPTPFKGKTEARYWAAHWNRENVSTAGELKAVQRQTIAIRRMAKQLARYEKLPFLRAYGQEFVIKLTDAYSDVAECVAIIEASEKRDTEPCQATT